MKSASSSSYALLAAGLLLLGWALRVPAAESSRLAFTAAPGGEFQFDTGVLRGTLRPKGRSIGLATVVHVRSGVRLDRSQGLFSHYRVFTTGQRYGAGAWDWPSTARLREDGAVEVRWGAETNRPFEMGAIYRWSAPDVLDLETVVRAQAELRGFESFLASYFGSGFSNALAYVGTASARGGAGEFMAAEKSRGDWQMFPRDARSAGLVNDGRWLLEPHPVKWVTMPALARPIGVRRDPVSGLSVALLGRTEDCFALMTPFQTEGHFSFYLSLFGRDVKAGETVRARTRLVVMESLSEQRLQECWEGLARPESAGRQ